MKRLAAIRVVSGMAAVALALSAVPVRAQVLPGLPVDREGLGKLDASGWTDARSDQAGLSLRFPCLYGEATKTGEVGSTSRTSWAFIMNCVRADKVVFSAMRADFHGDLVKAEQGFEELISRHGGEVLRRFTYKGAVAVDLKRADGGRCGWFRLIRAGSDNVALIVEGQGANCVGLDADIAKFFDSVEVRPR